MIRLKAVLLFFNFFFVFIAIGQTINPDEIINLSINSEYAELGAKFYKDGKVLFASSKINRIDNKRDRRANRQMGLRLYSGGISDDGAIINPTLFNKEINNPILEANIAFTSNYKTVYFTRNNYILDEYGEMFKNDTTETHILRIYKASINEFGELSDVISLPINSSSHSVTNPVLNSDNSKLYFSSNRSDSIGGFDLYELALFDDGTYGIPKNLGDKVNTLKNELFPFIDENNTLFYSSDASGGLGYLDVYQIPMSELAANKPENLGAPINSDKDDFAFVFSRSRNVGYVTSTRNGGIGDADIYAFNGNVEEELVVVTEIIGLEIDANLSEATLSPVFFDKDTVLDVVKSDPVPFEVPVIETDTDSIPLTDVAVVEVIKPADCTQTIEGYIFSKKSTVLDNATVTLYENGQNMGTFDVSPEGKYVFDLNCNSHYRVTARLNKFEESYFEIKTTRFTGENIAQNIELEKIPCDVLLTGKLKDIDTDSALSEVKVYLIENNAQINATQTDNKGQYSFIVPCDGDFKIATDLFGYEERVFDVDKSSVHNTTILLNNVLTPVECEQIVRGRINNEFDGSPIINAKVELLNDKNELIVAANSNNNGNFHFNIKCDTSYKLSISYDDFQSVETKFQSTDIQKFNHRVDFKLKPDVCLQTIAGSVINSRTKLVMNNVEVELLKDGELISSLHTSTDGTFSFEVHCNSNYRISATMKDYSIDSKEIATNADHGTISNISIILETKLDFELVRNKLMIITEEIDFDLNQSDIREDAAIELNKVVTIMTRNPEIKVDIGVHTDSRAPDNYNLSLSEQRAQSIMAFLLDRGVDANRLAGKGYGETVLLNECSNGVNCSETQHLVNRRIEFVVTR